MSDQPALPHGGIVCAAPAAVTGPAARAGALFPPKDADAETYRRWLAASPWPEVVFASAR
ncbi:hypothetical protein [Phycicoccus duodecadis]|uniref:Uncharacterized protein n=1 Tax=Phycicoccus duodecadis TaxID=173053 RepID=A0A2N3YNE6_9MICO|nr:hypothetical protein [Phycicoccus duodecadis]PKW28338.1 hypothetical protein ATL31_3204 [Phycicoccus duodecadis]